MDRFVMHKKRGEHSSAYWSMEDIQNQIEILKLKIFKLKKKTEASETKLILFVWLDN